MWNIQYDALVNYLLTLNVKVYLNIYLLSIKRVTSGRGQYQYLGIVPFHLLLAEEMASVASPVRWTKED